MDSGWIDCRFVLDGRGVTVSVRRLSCDERQRIAAEIAWFAGHLLTTNASSERWSMLLDRILSREVSITLDEERFSQADGAWDQIVCLSFQAFVTANSLDASIRGHLSDSVDNSARVL